MRLYESAITSRLVFSRKIGRPATFDFCNNIEPITDIFREPLPPRTGRGRVIFLQTPQNGSAAALDILHNLSVVFYQFNSNFLVGAFGDYDWSSLKGTSTQDLSNTLSPFFGVSGDEKQTGAWAAGVRLGYLPYPNLLTYVSGGWTQARFGEVDFFNHTANGFGALGIATGLFLPATTYNGWFIGAGYEYRLPWWQNLTWKTEYRYSEYSSKDILDQCGVISCGPIGVQTFGENSQKFVQTVTTSLVWRFNFGGASY